MSDERRCENCGHADDGTLAWVKATARTPRRLLCFLCRGWR
jgi:hypothetical protein